MRFITINLILQTHLAVEDSGRQWKAVEGSGRQWKAVDPVTAEAAVATKKSGKT